MDAAFCLLFGSCAEILVTNPYILVIVFLRAYFALFRIPFYSPKGLHYRWCEIQVSDLDRQRWIALERRRKEGRQKRPLV